MNKKALRPFSMVDKFGYALGDFGCNMSFSLVSNYMFLFYTQCIGLSKENWAWIIIVSKVWDAINDVIIGSLVDNKQISKKSKFKPWITIGSFGIIAFTIMIFSPISTFSEILKIIWCLLSYCLWSVAYTMVNVPYGSLHSVITDDPKQRTSLSSFRSIGAGFAMVIVMLLPKLVYENNILSQQRLFVVSIVFSLIAFLILTLMKSMVVERVERIEVPHKIDYFSAVKSFFSNRALIGITVATVASVVFFMSSATINNLVFQFFFGDAGKSALATIASYSSFIVLLPFTGKIVSKIGKKNYICITALVGLLAGLVLLFIPIQPNNSGMLIYILGLMLVNVGNGVFQIVVWAVVADCIELNFKKKGTREEGSLYALYSFFRKLSQGIGSAVVALSLGLVGYEESQTTQPLEVATGIKNLYIIFMIIGLLVMLLSMKFIYNIDFQKEQQLAESEKEVG